MSTTITLVPPCDFINANDRLHWRKRAELTKAWRQAAANAVGFDPYHYTRAHITAAIRFPNNRRRDVHNLYPTIKACIDGLVDSLILPDDADAYLVGPDLRRHIPNGTPLVTITIQEIP